MFLIRLVVLSRPASTRTEIPSPLNLLNEIEGAKQVQLKLTMFTKYEEKSIRILTARILAEFLLEERRRGLGSGSGSDAGSL